MSETIDKGRRVVMHFSLSLADGTPVDSSRAGEPLAFVLGDGTLEAGLEALVLGLCAGDRARFNLPPGQAFGEPDPGNVHRMARGEFPQDMNLEEGAVLAFSTPAGDEVPGTVVAVDDDGVEVDFNHPLAGRALAFEVEILSVEPA
jgi:FKBP-type peptidyl-prolyl cis-trans isomerase SlpA